MLYAAGACLLSCVRLFTTPWTVAGRVPCPWDSPGKNSGVGCHTLLQGFAPTQGSNLWVSCVGRWVLYHRATWEVNSAGWSGHGGGRCEGQRQLAFRVQVRLTQPLSSRPFLDMVYHALDSPDDDYHALFVLCLLYAMSHNKGKPLSSSAFREKDSCFPWRISFLVLADSHRTCLQPC